MSAKRPHRRCEAKYLLHLQNSDMTIVCGYDKHQVHKCVLSLWSDYFKRGANGEFEEADTGLFELKEADPEAVRYMIYFFYHGDYKLNRDFPRSGAKKRGRTPISEFKHDATTEKQSNLSLHARVYMTAQFFLVDKLKELALKHFVRLAGFYWHTAEFMEVFDKIFASGLDRQMQDAVLDILVKHPSLLREECADDIVRRHDLGYSILQRMLQSKFSEHEEAPNTDNEILGEHS